MNAYERETTVTTSDGDELVHIYTCQKRYITKLRRNSRVNEVKTGVHDGTEWAQFTVAASDWNPVTGVKRNTKPLTEAQKEVLRQQLNKLREDDHASEE